MFQSNIQIPRVWVFATLLSVASSVVAQADFCQDDVGERNPTTPSSDFRIVSDGIVEHRTTGLQWARCALGQQFIDGECVGDADVLTWSEAQQAVADLNRSGALGGYKDWRLPSVDELLSIVERCREAPSINPEIFPNTPWTGFWTATLHFDGQRRVDSHDPEHVDIDALSGAHEDDEDEEQQDKPLPREAWFVGFYRGLEYPYDINSGYRVRVVRTP
ncbi:MAG: hypothetical protein Kow0020_00210 [Wenzhouxiangellaceae bacterium]